MSKRKCCVKKLENSDTSSTTLVVDDGIPSSPSIGSSNDPSTGVNWIGNTLQLVSSGTVGLEVTPTAVTAKEDFVAEDGIRTNALQPINASPPAGTFQYIQMAGESNLPYFFRHRSTVNGYSGESWDSFGDNSVIAYNAGSGLILAYNHTFDDLDDDDVTVANYTTNMQVLFNQVRFDVQALFIEPLFFVAQPSFPTTASRIFNYNNDLYWQSNKVNTDVVVSGGSTTLTNEDIYRVTSDSVTLVLPVSSARDGHTITIVNIGGNWSTTINRQSTDTIDDGVATTMNMVGDRTHTSLRSDGSQLWMVV